MNYVNLNFHNIDKFHFITPKHYSDYDHMMIIKATKKSLLNYFEIT